MVGDGPEGLASGHLVSDDVSTEQRSAAAVRRRAEQRLAGYADLGITGLMPSAGLCRVLRVEFAQVR
jgi:hypothetical protein